MRACGVLFGALSMMLAAAGCGGEKARTPEADRGGSGAQSAQSPASATSTPAARGGAQSGHGAAGATPGSYEDWCGEHQVPESLCTRCNPSLVAAFKATGDWCAEHGLPESQCLACNPDLKIVRPAPTGGS